MTLYLSRILVVDDDAAFRHLLEIALTRCGHDVLTARDGNDALTQWQASDATISTIITDLDMPRMGGLELVRSVREAGFQGRIVIMSGGMSAEELKVVENCRVSGFFSKPFDVTILATLLSTRGHS